MLDVAVLRHFFFEAGQMQTLTVIAAIIHLRASHAHGSSLLDRKRPVIQARDVKEL